MSTIVRPATIADVGNVLIVCDQAWRGIWQGNVEMFIDRIIAFPKCGMVVGEIDGRIEGYISAQLSDETNILCNKWDEATDYGHLTKTHNPAGEWIHGVGLAVTSKGSKAGITRELIDFLYDFIIDEGKQGGRFVTRMLGYSRLKNGLTPEEYVLAVHNGKPLDPELRVLANYGLKVTNPPVIFTDYVEGGGDPRSCGLSVLVEILNQRKRDSKHAKS